MDWLLLIMAGLIGVGQLAIWRANQKTLRQLESVRAQLTLFRARQGEIRKTQAFKAPPTIVRPRTVARDTPDIPATGRMRDTTKRISPE